MAGGHMRVSVAQVPNTTWKLHQSHRLCSSSFRNHYAFDADGEGVSQQFRSQARIVSKLRLQAGIKRKTFLVAIADLQN